MFSIKMWLKNSYLQIKNNLKLRNIHQKSTKLEHRKWTADKKKIKKYTLWTYKWSKNSNNWEFVKITKEYKKQWLKNSSQ